MGGRGIAVGHAPLCICARNAEAPALDLEAHRAGALVQGKREPFEGERQRH